EQVEQAAANRDDIQFLGKRTPQQVREAMRAAAALIVPSTWDEVCPMVVVEALSEGRPALVTRKGGLPFLVGADTDRPAGWVTEPTVDDLADTLRRAAGEAQSLREVARRRYETTFAPSVVTDQLL